MANGFKEQPNFYLTTLNDEADGNEEDDENRPSMETLDRKIPNPFEVSVGSILITEDLPFHLLNELIRFHELRFTIN